MSKNDQSLFLTNVLLKDCVGLLEVTPSSVRWNGEEGSSLNSLEIPIASIKTLHVNPIDEAALDRSAASITKILLKITPESTEQTQKSLMLDPAGYLFNFMPNASICAKLRVKQRDDVKELLAKRMAILKESVLNRPSADSLQKASNSASSSAASVRAAGNGRSSVTVSAEDIRLRGMILETNADVQSLHRILVGGGQLTEEDFWLNRRQLVENMRIMCSQSTGIVPTLSADAQTAGDAAMPPSGNMKFVLTPAVIDAIFVQFPALQQKYHENVPEKMSEKEFWTAYFTSKYFVAGAAGNVTAGHNSSANKNNRMSIFEEAFRQEEQSLFGAEPATSTEGLGTDASLNEHSKISLLIRRFNVQSINILRRSAPSGSVLNALSASVDSNSLFHAEESKGEMEHNAATDSSLLVRNVPLTAGNCLQQSNAEAEERLEVSKCCPFDAISKEAYDIYLRHLFQTKSVRSAPHIIKSSFDAESPLHPPSAAAPLVEMLRQFWRVWKLPPKDAPDKQQRLRATLAAAESMHASLPSSAPQQKAVLGGVLARARLLLGC